MKAKRGWLSNGRTVVEEGFCGVGLIMPVPQEKRMAAVFSPAEMWSDAINELNVMASELASTGGTLHVKVISPREHFQSISDRLAKLGYHCSGRPLDANEKVDLMLDAASGVVKIARPRAARILIVDDSPTVRKMVRHVLEGSGLEVCGETGDPMEVRDLLVKLKPDVMTLDINMPKMNGDQLLKELFPAHFVPTIVISSLGLAEGRAVLDALENGAVDYLQKPDSRDLEEFGRNLSQRIEIARTRKSPPQRARAQSKAKVRSTSRLNTGRLIAIGASTGGTEAVRDVLTRLPAEVPPILIVQHIPPYFSQAFAERLNSLCAFKVQEALNGDELLPNRALVAPGGKQMRVAKRGGKLVVEITDDPPVTSHKPSVDYLFRSLVELKLKQTVAVLMTGMGKDGAMGLKALRDLGCFTMAQDEASSVVFGMPKAAIQLGAAEEIVGLEEMADRLCLQLEREAA